LVPVVTEQLVNHAHAHARFVAELKSAAGVLCSTHTLAECYATPTALPLPIRISALAARTANCKRLVTYNLKHFQPFAAASLAITLP
jgi:hypothetical protein